MIFLNGWPQPGVKALGPEIEARTIRTFELEPFLSATAKRLQETAAVFRSLQEKSSLPQVLAGRRAVEQAQAEAGRKMEELRTLPAGQLVADWERLKSEYERFDRDCEALSARGVALAGLTEAQLAGREPVQDFLAFVVPAITNDRLLPDRLPAGVKSGQAISLTACPGEYESASFALYALADLPEVRVTASDLQGPGGRISAAALDLRVVKVWYQAGRNYADSFEIVGDLLDLPVFAGQPDVAVGQAYHSVRAKILSYANPQGGVEEAETYRRNYGLSLWKAGYDGACTYAYQHSFGHAWDDYDDPTYRDHNMAYPTVNGVIPTVQWEGYREGYDDLRYLATLEHWIERGQWQGGAAAERARKAKLWLLRMQPDRADLNELRQEMIANILALQQVLAGGEG